MRATTVATIIVCVVSGACKSQYRSPGVAIGERPNTVAAEELALVEPHASLMDALQRLRPGMLSPRRGDSPVVSIDEAPPEDVGVLRGISADMIREVKLVRVASELVRQKQWRGSDIRTDYVILVWTKRASRDGD